MTPVIYGFELMKIPKKTCSPFKKRTIVPVVFTNPEFFWSVLLCYFYCH